MRWNSLTLTFKKAYVSITCLHWLFFGFDSKFQASLFSCFSISVAAMLWFQQMMSLWVIAFNIIPTDIVRTVEENKDSWKKCGSHAKSHIQGNKKSDLKVVLNLNELSLINMKIKCHVRIKVRLGLHVQFCQQSIVSHIPLFFQVCFSSY